MVQKPEIEKALLAMNHNTTAVAECTKALSENVVAFKEAFINFAARTDEQHRDMKEELNRMDRRMEYDNKAKNKLIYLVIVVLIVIVFVAVGIKPEFIKTLVGM